MKVKSENKALFAQAFKETSTRHAGLAKELKTTYPALLELWQRDFPQLSLSLARPKDYRRFMTQSFSELNTSDTAKKAIVEFTKTLGAILGRPDIRKCAVATAHKYDI